MEEIMVSVLCATYNQEKYIKEALDSFIKQKTSFKFEVIINDDASTDATPLIIKEYEKMYPSIIKPIYQKENQYSKNGISITRDFLITNAKGKYFALCEGDDFWTDEYKLQKQFDYMERNPECSLCISNGIRVSENGEFMKEHIIKEEDTNITTEEVIIGGGGFCFTNSIFAPLKLVYQLPFYYAFLPLDYSLQIYLASCGYTHLIKDKMAAYRVQAKGSWTVKRMKETTSEKIKHSKRVIKMLEMANEETCYKYNNAIDIVIDSCKVDIMLTLFSNKGFTKEILMNSKKCRKKKEMAKIYLLYFSPFLLKVFLNIKEVYKKIYKKLNRK